MARRMWSKHDLLRFADAEITGEDTMKRMWSKHDLLRCIGAEITGEDTMKRMWSREELIDLLSKPVQENNYFNYAKDYYTATNNSALFENAWEHSLTVDPSEIERNSTITTQYGILQYPNGEDNGVIIPNGVTSIGSSAFRGWSSNNQPLVIPNSVTSIGSSAFRGWSSNSQPLVIPNSVTSIGDGAFSQWTANSHPLVIPDSVTSIGDGAFSQWTANSHPLVIPDSVTSIGNYAFQDWSLVPYVEMQAITPPTLASSNAFNGLPYDAPIYVPDESVDDYKTATNWVDLEWKIFPISEKQ